MQELPKIVRSRLAGPEAPSSHPEADLLSAFAEQALPEGERLQVLDHLMGCEPCREVLSLSTSEEVAAEVVPARPGLGALFAWPRLRWVGLAATLVLGAALFFWRDPRSANFAAAPSMRRATVAALTAEQEAIQFERPTEREPAGLNAAGRVSWSQAGASTAPAAAHPKAMSNQLARNAKSPATPSTAPLRKAPGNAPELGANLIAGGPEVSQSASSPELRWGLTSDGGLLLSRDGGTIWAPAPSRPPGGRLFAIWALGISLWVGGENGQLYHSADGGEHWTLLHPSASDHALTGSIVRIDFRDLQNGSVISDTGEIWSTHNGGQDWTKQSPEPSAR